MPPAQTQSSDNDSLRETIVTVLLAQSFINADQAEQVKLSAAQTGKTLEDIIREQNLVSEEQLALAKSILFKIPYIELEPINLTQEVVSLIPEEVAKKYVLVPYEKKGNVLKVALADMSDLGILEFLQQKTGFEIEPYLASKTEVEAKIQTAYTEGLSSEVSSDVEQAGTEVQVSKAASPTETVSGEVLRDAPIAKIVAQLIEYGIKVRASDIHIEPLEDKTRVRSRIDGILQEKLILPKKIHDSVVSRIKILADLKIDERRIPQDGRFNFKIGEEELDLRISSLPTVHGEKIVMRLLKKTGGVPTMNELGLRGTALKSLETQILRPHGIILVTGPTGSGKTTTLYSVLSKLNSIRVNIITLEDPIEYQMPGINQVQINPQAGLTFANGLRSFLRQDPNIIMVGEIRDDETANLAIQASLTGHLVFSTLHTNNSAGALPRLLDMHAEPYLIASTVNGVVAQRVVRKICPDCKAGYQPPPEITTDITKVLGNLFKPASPFQLFKGQGCTHCGNTGYSGRIGIFEVLTVSEKIARLILEHQTSAEIEKMAVSEGMITMKQDGYLKIVEGVTTIEEVLRVAQE